MCSGRFDMTARARADRLHERLAIVDDPHDERGVRLRQRRAAHEGERGRDGREPRLRELLPRELLRERRGAAPGLDRVHLRQIDPQRLRDERAAAVRARHERQVQPRRPRHRRDGASAAWGRARALQLDGQPRQRPVRPAARLVGQRVRDLRQRGERGELGARERVRLAAARGG